MRKTLSIVTAMIFTLVATPISHAAEGGSAASHLWWEGAELSATSSMSQVIEPYEISIHTYWEAGWFWTGYPDGGYGGIQAQGLLGNGTVSDLAIFSIWNATEAEAGPTSFCLPFGGEGIGMSCRVPIVLKAHDHYKITYAQDAAHGPYWWMATIEDLDTNYSALIGRIKAPYANMYALNWNNFIEYWAEPRPCDQVGPATAKFYLPRSSNPNVFISSVQFSRPQNPCVNSAGDTPPAGQPGDVIMRFGGSEQAPSTQSMPIVDIRPKVTPSPTPTPTPEVTASPTPSPSPVVSGVKKVAPQKVLVCIKGKSTMKMKAGVKKCPKGYKATNK